MDQVDKVRKLLRLAESSPYEAEAKMARERAERLIIQHGLTASDLREEAMVAFETRDVSYFGPAYCGYDICNGIAEIIQALNTVAVYLCCRVHKGRKRYLGWILYGRPSDLNHAELLIGSLQRQQDWAMKRWWRKYRSEARSSSHGQKMKRGYIAVWMTEVRDRAKSMYREEKAALGKELVLNTRVRAEKEYLSQSKVEENRKPSQRRYDWSGYLDAQEEARKAHFSVTDLEPGLKRIETS